MKAAVRDRYGPPGDVVALVASTGRSRARTRCSSGSMPRP